MVLMHLAIGGSSLDVFYLDLLDVLMQSQIAVEVQCKVSKMNHLLLHMDHVVSL